MGWPRTSWCTEHLRHSWRKQRLVSLHDRDVSSNGSLGKKYSWRSYSWRKRTGFCSREDTVWNHDRWPKPRLEYLFHWTEERIRRVCSRDSWRESPSTTLLIRMIVVYKKEAHETTSIMMCVFYHYIVMTIIVIMIRVKRKEKQPQSTKATRTPWFYRLPVLYRQ